METNRARDSYSFDDPASKENLIRDLSMFSRGCAKRFPVLLFFGSHIPSSGERDLE